MYKSHMKAQFVALLAFSIMYFGAVVFVAYERPLAERAMVRLLLNLDAYLASIVAGYLAAAVIRQRGVMVGALTGISAAVLVGTYHLLYGAAGLVISDWRFWSASILLGGLGGLIWRLRDIALNMNN